jgi:hypothetical protein
LAGFGPAPDPNRFLTLDNHVVAEQMRDTQLRAGGMYVAQPKQASHHDNTDTVLHKHYVLLLFEGYRLFWQTG